MSKLCLTLAEQSFQKLQDKLSTYRDRVPMIEIRLDYLDPVRIPGNLKSKNNEIIATCRPKREGGLFNGSEDKRLRILQSAAEAGCDWIDLESDVPGLIQVPKRTRVIRSEHRFDQFPEQFEADLNRLRELPGDMVKLAVSPQKISHIGILMKWLEETRDQFPRVVIGMGDVGWPTRILASQLGNAWTYVVESVSGSIAPGQFSLNQARESFRLDQWEHPPDLICVVGPYQWIWDLSLRMNHLLRLQEVNALCVPVLGEDTDTWVEYVKDSKLPFLGIGIYRPDKWAEGEAEVLSLRNKVWKHCKTKSPPFSDPLHLQPGLEFLIEQFEIWTDRKIDSGAVSGAFGELNAK